MTQNILSLRYPYHKYIVRYHLYLSICLSGDKFYCSYVVCGNNDDCTSPLTQKRHVIRRRQIPFSFCHRPIYGDTGIVLGCRGMWVVI